MDETFSAIGQNKQALSGRLRGQVAIEAWLREPQCKKTRTLKAFQKLAGG